MNLDLCILLYKPWWLILKYSMRSPKNEEVPFGSYSWCPHGQPIDTHPAWKELEVENLFQVPYGVFPHPNKQFHWNSTREFFRPSIPLPAFHAPSKRRLTHYVPKHDLWCVQVSVLVDNSWHIQLTVSTEHAWSGRNLGQPHFRGRNFLDLAVPCQLFLQQLTCIICTCVDQFGP